ncbi:hypothetical protein U1Q18_023417, partial [Sarracenia purpurea var. burkii]
MVAQGINGNGFLAMRSSASGGFSATSSSAGFFPPIGARSEVAEALVGKEDRREEAWRL